MTRTSTIFSSIARQAFEPPFTYVIVLESEEKRLNKAMEIQKVIEYLSQQRAIIDQTIFCLERLNDGAVLPTEELPPAKRRGRKFMHAEDRQKVSERMKVYWASRRNGSGEHTIGEHVTTGHVNGSA